MRNYRLVRLAGLHYISDKLYRDNPGLDGKSYADQQRVLFEESYFYSNGMTNALSCLGHETHEIVYDLEIMQKQWAHENGLHFREDSWRTDIILGQIEKIRPDVVYFQDIESIPVELRRDFKRLFPFIKLKVVHKGSVGLKPLDDFDLLLIGIPSMLEKYRAQGLNAQLLYHAFDECIYNKLSVAGYNDNRYLCDFSFVGSSGFGHHPHAQRYWELVELGEKTNIRFWIDELESMQNKLCRFLNNIGFQGDVQRTAMWLCGLTLHARNEEELIQLLPVFMEKAREALEVNMVQRKGFPVWNIKSRFPARCSSPVYGLNMYDVLRRSKVTFNSDMVARQWGDVVNMRMFEATGMGTCLVTDLGKNMNDLFESDREVVTYTCIEEGIEKVRFLLDHEDVRANIAEAGRQRTLRNHTMSNRAGQVDAMIQKMLARGGANYRLQNLSEVSV